MDFSYYLRNFSFLVKLYTFTVNALFLFFLFVIDLKQIFLLFKVVCRTS
jgi:hypothetical protein